MYSIDELLALDVDNSASTLTRRDFASREIERYADLISRTNLPDGVVILRECYQGTKVEIMKKWGRTQYILKL